MGWVSPVRLAICQISVVPWVSIFRGGIRVGSAKACPWTSGILVPRSLDQAAVWSKASFRVSLRMDSPAEYVVGAAGATSPVGNSNGSFQPAESVEAPWSVERSQEGRTVGYWPRRAGLTTELHDLPGVGPDARR